MSALDVDEQEILATIIARLTLSSRPPMSRRIPLRVSDA